jgi:LCP family protein required for cell wall assembly
MLVSLDRERNEAWILQLPRDTYAAYTDRSYKKLNGAPQTLGSMEQTNRFLSEALGVEIDRYVRLSPDVLRDAVDAVGGVEIELDRTMYYNDPEQGLSIYLKKGKQTLDGEQAEQLVRYRWGYARGDLDRMDVQKRFLSSFLRKVRDELTIPTAIRLASTLWGEVETDLRLSELTGLIGEAMALKETSVFLVTAPGTEATAKSGASYYALSAPAMQELLCEHFGAEADAFDRERVFLNDRNSEFQKIYETYVPYCVWCAAESE